VVNNAGGVRWSLLAMVVLVVGALSWVGWRFWLSSGHLLGGASWVSSILLVVMAALVIGAGLPVRRFLQGRATKPLSPIRAARTLVLAQAAALTGSAVLGWYAAQVAHALADLDLPGYRGVLWRLLALCLGAVVLAVAGMVTQAWCRIDGSGRDGDGAAAAGGAGGAPA
jgi:hypothetical protein